MKTTLVIALLLTIASSAAGYDGTTRPVGPALEWSADDLSRFDAAWVHVKFVEGSEVTLANDRFVGSGGGDLTGVNAVVADAVQLRRTFPGDPLKFQTWKARGEAASGRPGPDLSLWFDVQLPADRTSLAGVLNALNGLAVVEIAHPAPVCETAGIMGADSPADAGAATTRLLPTPDFTGMQDYLYDPPVGLDAPAAWAQPGGAGQGMKFIDVELGWIFSHEDFSPLRQFYGGGAVDPDYTDHGTAVMGEVVGVDNTYGITGFANQARWGTVAITVDEWPDVPHYFLEAAEALRPGDVWLIELQMYPPGRDATPMEWLQVNYDVIWTSCWSLEVICIEAGANGSQNLDASYWDGVFDREVRDSGAIMVGAGTPIGRIAESFTNYGSRMDVNAWGSSIVTTGYGDLQGGDERFWYTQYFGGTSGASPMVAGSALCLQGIAKSAHGEAMAPVEVRQLLNETGTPHQDPSREIGPRPDLAAAVEQLLGATAAPAVNLTSGLVVTGAISPFDGSTEIRFRQARQGAVRLSVYDIAGHRVRTIDLPAAEGPRRVQWDGRNAAGREVSSGVYLFRLESRGEVASGRVVKVH